jgi:hypothetical protein
LQRGPSDSCLPSSSSVTHASPLLPFCHCRSPPAPCPKLYLLLAYLPTRRPLPAPTSFLSPGGLSRARHDDPEPPPAATSSSRWNAHPRALTPSLLRAAAPLPRPHYVLLLPIPNSERPSRIPPPPSSSAPAAHGTSMGNPHQTISTPINLCTSFPVARWCSSTTRCPPISTETSSPTKRRRRRHLRPHRGQLAPSLSTPPWYPSQHYIIPLVHHRASPTLAGVLPRRRHFGLRRSPSIQHLFIQLIARAPSP